MLEPRQIKEAEFLKKGIKGRYKKEAEQFSESCADTIEQLMTENVKVRTENTELSESTARMNEVITNFENERNELLSRLTDASEIIRVYEENREQVTAALISARNSADEIISDAKSESEKILMQGSTVIGDAEAKAAAIRAEAEEYAARLREQTENECAARLARLDSELTRRTLAFESVLSADAAKWGEADKALKAFRLQLAELLERMPPSLTDVVGENVKAVWERAVNNENK